MLARIVISPVLEMMIELVNIALREFWNAKAQQYS
jgi:hypothetical protein